MASAAAVDPHSRRLGLKAASTALSAVEHDAVRKSVRFDLLFVRNGCHSTPKQDKRFPLLQTTRGYTLCAASGDFVWGRGIIFFSSILGTSSVHCWQLVSVAIIMKKRGTMRVVGMHACLHYVVQHTRGGSPSFCLSPRAARNHSRAAMRSSSTIRFKQSYQLFFHFAFSNHAPRRSPPRPRPRPLEAGGGACF